MSHFGLGLISGGGTPGNDSFTKVLLHFDGVNGSQVFTDMNAAGLSNTWTASNANPVLTTSNFKFGPSCFTAAASIASWISTPAKAALDIGSQDFAIDFWINEFTGAAGGIAGYAWNNTGSTPGAPDEAWLITKVSNNIWFDYSNGSSVSTLKGASSVASGWHHVAITRSGTALRLFVDGILDASTTFGGTFPTLTGALRIGNLYPFGSDGFSKGIDEFRLSVGIARWTANFTPPTSAYI